MLRESRWILRISDFRTFHKLRFIAGMNRMKPGVGTVLIESEPGAFIHSLTLAVLSARPFASFGAFAFQSLLLAG